MRIVVLVKEVPDTYGERKLSLETGLAERTDGEGVLDEICERALEVALAFADANPGTKVTAISMGPEQAQPSIRKALAMGAGTATHIVDDALIGADLVVSARVLAAAVRQVGFDLVITGNQSSDGSGGVLGAMLAEHLGVPHATALSNVEFSSNGLRGTRPSEDGTAHVITTLPALISITEALPPARFPNFKGTMAAKKKQIEILTLEDLGVTVDPHALPMTVMTAVAEKPARGAGRKITDEGDAGHQLAEFLVENRLA